MAARKQASMKEQLVARILQCPNLPSLPTVAVQVLELAGRVDVDVADIARIISRDAALSAKVLRTVNSSFYGHSKNVATLSHALVILGLRSARTLSLGFSLAGTLAEEKPNGFKHLTYWKRSIYAATAARVFAGRLKIAEQEEAFLAALLQDIGMLVLDRVLGPEYGSIYQKSACHADLASVEKKALGMDHAAVGGVIAGHWKLPPLLAVPIAAHHAPEQCADPNLRGLVELVSLAGVCADVFVEESAAAAIASVRQRCKDRHQMTDAECDAALDEIDRGTRDVAALLEINIGSATAYEQILNKATETLISIAARRAPAAPVARSASTPAALLPADADPLTGLAGRSRIEQFLSQQFDSAIKQSRSLSIVLLDVDGFKAINERHNVVAGDRVLKAVAALLKSAARPSDLPGRRDADEFVLILPDTARATASAVAESIRRAVAARKIGCGTSEIAITASVGVVSMDPAARFKDPAQFLKAADLAVGAARQSGRNCVRVFSIKNQVAA